MKSKLTTTKLTKAKPIKFPLLARHVTGRELIVLFTANTVGVCVWCKDDPAAVGRNGECWVPVTDAASWVVLPPNQQVVLSN